MHNSESGSDLMHDVLKAYLNRDPSNPTAWLSTPAVSAWRHYLSTTLNNAGNIGMAIGVVGGIIVTISTGPITLPALAAGFVMGSKVGTGAETAKEAFDIYCGEDCITHTNQMTPEEKAMRATELAAKLSRILVGRGFDQLLRRYDDNRKTFLENQEQGAYNNGQPQPATATAGGGQSPANNWFNENQQQTPRQGSSTPTGGSQPSQPPTIKAGTDAGSGFKHHANIEEHLLERKINLPTDFNNPKLRSKFNKHKDIFGMEDVNFNKQNAEVFKQKIVDHVNNPDTIPIAGEYTRGNVGNVVHYYNPKTEIDVMKDTSGNFVSVWELNDEQLQNLKRSGKIGGG